MEIPFYANTLVIDVVALSNESSQLTTFFISQLLISNYPLVCTYKHRLHSVHCILRQCVPSLINLTFHHQ